MINRQASSTSFGRIYGQAAEFTERFWNDLNQDQFNFSDILKEINGSETIVFNNLIELKTFRTKIRRQLEFQSEQLDTQYAVPFLVDLMSSFYDPKYESRSFLPIISAKIAIGFIWKNTYSNPLASDKSYRQLFQVLTISALFVLLEQLIRVWEFEDLGEVIMNELGLIQNEIYNYYGPQFILQGRHEYKVINDAINQIWLNDDIYAKMNFIVGEGLPKDVKLFGNTFLSEIPLNNKKFWYQVWSKLQLYRLAIKERDKVVGESMKGVCIIPSSVIGLFGANLENAIPMQKVIFENFWWPDWYKSQIKNNYFILQGMIVERPAIRFVQSENAFATSVMLIHDSVNALLEDYVHSPAGARIYEKFFTQPFERSAINIFRKHGYLAGEVTTSGMWKLDTPVELKGGFKMPGQIDVLIVRDDQKLVIVADCKMLHFPYEVSTLRNLRSKFTKQDTDGFYKKLRKKVIWIKSCQKFPSDYNFQIMLITNRHIVLPADNEHLVFSITELDNILNEQFPFSQ